MLRLFPLPLALALSVTLFAALGTAGEPAAPAEAKPAAPVAPDKPGTPENPPAPLPPPLKEYMGRRIALTMHYSAAPWLTRESRNREEEPAKLMKALELKEGQVVCDMGCGNGFYTLPIGKAVGAKGKVYAVEIQPQMLDLLKQRAGIQGLENIVPILGTETDPKLPENAIDLMLLVDVYHEFDRPVHMLDAIKKSLKADGLMVLVEFRAEDPKVPIKPEHKMSKKQINAEMAANGFELVKEFDELPWQHVMWFKKK